MVTYTINKTIYRFMLIATIVVLLQGIYWIGAMFLSPGYLVHRPTQQVTTAPPPYHGIGVYIIHLDRSKERLPFIMKQVKPLGLPIHLIHAVDGRKIPPGDIQKLLVKNSGMRLGGLGCSLSHLKAYQTFLSSHERFALVVEDDVTIPTTTMLKTLKYLTEHQQYWDVVNFANNLKEHGESPLFLPWLTSLNINHQFVLGLTHFDNSGGYLLKRDLATKLLARGKPVQLPSDIIYRRDWEFDSIAVETIPALVTQSLNTSYVETFDHPKVGWFTKIFAHPAASLKTNWMRSTYHLKLYARKTLGLL